MTSGDPEGTVKKWELLSVTEQFTALPWVRLFRDSVKLPGGRVIDDFYRVKLPDYVLIYPRMDDGTVLFERMYLHGLGDITLALPSGCIEEGEPPQNAAERELMEETGYRAARWTALGSFLIDGNKECARAHLYMAEGLSKTDEPVINDMEAIDMVFIPECDVISSLKNKEISLLPTAALIAIAALHRETV